ncbi:hypothetical protein NEHOM01_1319 [Nematocida homosporus]|uniref:uncharacterized protein n=1 Tax=Nematocida homosporus TaxID=1912981 RepID=UPI002220F975|nr:uncharacterized protein NEHOM01_1319 [Nematocida homosporus]KAI5186154.1 hypothetical protein NEHOM01_1319 [Nematocida homosporus]
MSIESECLELISSKGAKFMLAAQRYRVMLLESQKPTKSSDVILSYFLLSLLVECDSRRFCLVRASLQSLLEQQDLPCVRVLDGLWQAGLLGDIPQMKHLVNALPASHHELGERAIAKLTNSETEQESCRAEEREEGKIQGVIRMSELFFRV